MPSKQETFNGTCEQCGYGAECYLTVDGVSNCVDEQACERRDAENCNAELYGEYNGDLAWGIAWD